jgi:hypothetical protein
MGRFFLRVLGKTIEYILLPVLGIILYKAWGKDKYWAMSCVAILLAERIWAIVREEKARINSVEI